MSILYLLYIIYFSLFKQNIFYKSKLILFIVSEFLTTNEYGFNELKKLNKKKVTYLMTTNNYSLFQQ